MKKIYFGGPLFSESELNYNAQLVQKIRERFKGQVDVYLPQENEAINDKSGYASSIDIFEGDVAYLDESDLLIALLDGPVVDPGLAAEIGYYYHLDRPILALYSDMRQGHFNNQQKIDALEETAESQFSYINLFVVGAVKKRGQIVKTSDQLLDAIDQWLNA
ncbi:nucleoside 2-deoxyribosyltransferase [Dolosicoccus paucivorans]|nr:nucleoside 2-deoxyribosyltransferase [Dolosicoccus paucivorans]SDI52964.1 Nucleoside 2-deoxyribosyltransferase [Dolosicoccus paucivorans]